MEKKNDMCNDYDDDHEESTSHYYSMMGCIDSAPPMDDSRIDEVLHNVVTTSLVKFEKYLFTCEIM